MTAPTTEPLSKVAGLAGDATRGERVFWMAGCASCHAADKAEGEARLVLSGGKRFPSPFGTFIAPNISPDPDHGIGGWSAHDLVNAMRHGTSPDGSHYFPAFPYTSYARMPVGDIIDLKAFLDTLPASAVASLPHEVGFPFNIRRAMGGWKLLFFRDGPVVDPAGLSEAARAGQAIVEGPGHCGECHSPRNPLGGINYGGWLTGAATPDGKGKIPGIDPATLGWSAEEIAEYLKSGFTPEFDSAGGLMAEVVENTANLTDADRAAIGAYLTELPR